jgi:hypothetical protein
MVTSASGIAALIIASISWASIGIRVVLLSRLQSALSSNRCRGVADLQSQTRRRGQT